MLSFRLVSQLFGDAPAATLPFHPPPFLQKLTHRGLTDADPRQCSAVSGTGAHWLASLATRSHQDACELL